MFEFKSLCKEVEELDPETWNAMIIEKSDNVIDQLTMMSKDEISGLTMFYGLVLGAIVSDGKLDKGEFSIIKPFLETALKREVDYSFASMYLSLLKPETEEYKKFVNTSVDMIGEMSEELKIDMIILCMLICGADGKISNKEKKWLKKLIK